jgi:outer membrane protein OmpA-like peptidoglycan-associated protein
MQLALLAVTACSRPAGTTIPPSEETPSPKPADDPEPTGPPQDERVGRDELVGGCPQAASPRVDEESLDCDDDGLPDRQDSCISTSETWNGYHDLDGCPDELPQDLARLAGTLAGVRFAKWSARLDASAEAALREAARVLAKYPDVRVEISAHTDPTGTSDRNREITLQQAQVVVDELVRLEIARGRLTSRGAGDSEPASHGPPETWHERCRRIELTVLVAPPRTH